MAILKKLVTLLRGGVREAGDTLLDDQALRVLEREITDQARAIDKAKEALTEIMADQSTTATKISELNNRISDLEAQAAQAIAQGNEAIALSTAEKIAALETERHDVQALLDGYNTSVTGLQEQIRHAEKVIQENRRELSVAKATANAQKARAALNDSLTSNISKASAARDTLTRIRERQQHRDDKMHAAKQLDSETGDTLQERLAEAGITDSSRRASEVVTRLTQKYPLSENILKNLIVVAMTDNRIHDNERTFLMTLAGQMGVDQEHLARLIREVMHGNRKQLYALDSPQEFEWLCKMALANGAADEKQQHILKKLGALIGLEEPEIQEKIQEQLN